MKSLLVSWSFNFTIESWNYHFLAQKDQNGKKVKVLVLGDSWLCLSIHVLVAKYLLLEEINLSMILKQKCKQQSKEIKKYQYLSSISLIELNFCYTINFRSVISLKTDRIIEMLYEL